LLGSDGTTVLATANINPAVNPSLAPTHVAQATAHIHPVFGGTADNAQLYEIDLDFTR
jgi:hypothetical protein